MDGQAVSAGPAVQAGYALLIPGGWRRIRVASAADARLDIQAVLDEVFDGLPRDRAAPWRARFERSLTAQVQAARSQHGLDLYLPITPAGGRPVPASFLVTQLPPLGARPVEAGAEAAVLAELAGVEPGDRSQVLTLAGRPALRREHAPRSAPEGAPAADQPGTRSGVQPGQADDGELPSRLESPARRVDYVVSAPGDAGWLVLSFSTMLPEGPAAEPVVAVGATSMTFDDVLVELFDAIVSTLRWSHG